MLGTTRTLHSSTGRSGTAHGNESRSTGSRPNSRNLRAAFRWAADRRKLTLATAIAAHAAIMSWPLQRFEPVSWTEEILPAATDADLPQLPRLYVAASLCLYGGRPDVGVGYAEEAERLESDPRYEPFVDGWSGLLQALAHLFGGRIDRRVEICTELATRRGSLGSSASAG